MVPGVPARIMRLGRQATVGTRQLPVGLTFQIDAMATCAILIVERDPFPCWPEEASSAAPCQTQAPAAASTAASRDKAGFFMPSPGTRSSCRFPDGVCGDSAASSGGLAGVQRDCDYRHRRHADPASRAVKLETTATRTAILQGVEEAGYPASVSRSGPRGDN